MDSHQLFRLNHTTGSDLSHSRSHPNLYSQPDTLITALKLDIGNSPNIPFSRPFDCGSITTFSDQSQEQQQRQQSSSDNLSGQQSPSFNLSVDSWSGFRDVLTLSSLSSSSSVQEAACSQDIKHALLELETVLMGPEEDDEVTTPSSTSHAPEHRSLAWNHGSQVIRPHLPTVSRPLLLSEAVGIEGRRKYMEEMSLHGFPPINLKQLLIACAKALSENRIDHFDILVERARSFVSIVGDPIQRLGAYMIEALVARKAESGSNIYHAFRCREPEGKDLLSYLQILYEICPYLKFGYMAANGAIADACRNEDRIHIIDFHIAQGTQWITLLQAFAARPSGAPHVRITGIDDPVSKYARGEGLEAVERRLALLSEKFNIPIEFHGIPEFAPDITVEMLNVRPGEALAVNFPLQLHHTPDESVDVNNPRDGLLRMVKSLSPKVTTLVEQESNTNTTPFLTRFVETLDYYLAMFESIDATLPRDKKERINVEQHCLARDIVNVIACEGKQRVERHELLGKWKSRLSMAGFRPYTLSPYVNSVIRILSRSYSEHYTLVERDGAMLLGWKDRFLISASAWH